MVTLESVNVEKLTPTELLFWGRLGGLQRDPLAPLIMAIAYNETLSGYSFESACFVISEDDGHGVMQLTSSWPTDWSNPFANAEYALAHFIEPAADYWGIRTQDPTAFVRLVAATFNEGLGAAIRYHLRGNVDAGTTDNYGARALANYKRITAR